MFKLPYHTYHIYTYTCTIIRTYSFKKLRVFIKKKSFSEKLRVNTFHKSVIVFEPEKMNETQRMRALTNEKK